VIREACKQARAWSEMGLPPFVMSVNVSPRQFRAGEALVASVKEALSGSGLHAGRLQIEITEGAMMENRGESLLTLNQLKALGVTIAVDDFGTGYPRSPTSSTFRSTRSRSTACS
jgi:EAL domain-containing protein (putative c-di-GMP-specific phosphodiesterase class I)